MVYTCGFIGLGEQGAPIARRMIGAGFPMMLWARRAESLDPFSDTTAMIANSIAELAEQVDYVGVCVAGDANAEEIGNQLIRGMRSGSRIAIHSTTHPDTSRLLARAAATRGIMLLDAPVSGGRPAAQAGTLTIMVGGDETAVAAMRPIFETFASSIMRLGDAGAGQIAKLINNSLLGANLAVAHMAVTAGVELGLDREALISLLGHSSGRSFGLEAYGRQRNLEQFRSRLNLLEQVRLLASLMEEGHNPSFRLRYSVAHFFEERVGRAQQA